MKKCCKCCEYKEESGFNYSGVHKFKLQPFCRICQIKYFDEYFPKHKEDYARNTRIWRANNPEYKENERIRKAVIRLLTLGGDKIHSELGYSGNQARKYLDISEYKKGILDIDYSKKGLEALKAKAAA